MCSEHGLVLAKENQVQKDIALEQNVMNCGTVSKSVVATIDSKKHR